MTQVFDVNVQFNTFRGVDAITRPANTDVYTAGDVVSEVTSNDHFTFEEVNRPGGIKKHLGGSIATARLHSSANQATKLDGELWLFSQDIAEVADNGAFAPTDAEMLTLVGIIDFPVANWKEGIATAGAAGNAVCEAFNLGLAYKGGLTSLFGQLVVRNAYTPVSGEIFTCEIIVSRD